MWKKKEIHKGYKANDEIRGVSLIRCVCIKKVTLMMKHTYASDDKRLQSLQTYIKNMLNAGNCIRTNVSSVAFQSWSSEFCPDDWKLATNK